MNIIKLFTVFLLMSATIGLFHFAKRYESTGPELLQNGNFHQGLEGWSKQSGSNTITASSGFVVVENKDASHSVSLSQIVSLPSGQNEVMLVAEISTEGVEKGDYPHHKACLYLVGRNKEGKYLWKQPHMVTTLTGTNGWALFSKAFSPVKDAVELVVGMSLNHATGVMRVRNLSLKPVREREGFRMAVYGLLVCWSFILLWIGIPIFRLARFNLAHILIAVVTVCIFLGTLIPGSTKSDLLFWVHGEYVKLFPSLSPELQSISDPQGIGGDNLFPGFGGMGHFALFAVLAFLLRKARPKDKFLLQFFCLMLFAAMTEVFQFFTIDRGPRIGDWLIDVSGLAVGFVVWWRVVKRRADNK